MAELGSFARYLARALAAIEHEAPDHFRNMQRQLADRSVSIRVADGDPIRLCLSFGPPWLDHGSEADVHVGLTEPDLDAFLRGELSLEQGLMQARLAVRGRLDDVVPCLEALQTWLHGALRCPAAARLHREYLEATPVVEGGVS